MGDSPDVPEIVIIVNWFDALYDIDRNEIDCSWYSGWKFNFCWRELHPFLLTMEQGFLFRKLFICLLSCLSFSLISLCSCCNVFFVQFGKWSNVRTSRQQKLCKFATPARKMSPDYDDPKKQQPHLKICWRAGKAMQYAVHVGSAIAPARIYCFAITRSVAHTSNYRLLRWCLVTMISIGKGPQSQGRGATQRKGVE